ncbi:MAG: hypothetical protein WCI73_09725 [Phycisphaerae bacterium]
MTTNSNNTKQTVEQVKIEHVDATLPRVTPAAAEQVQPVAARPIQWASMEDVERELELLKNRQWLNEELISNAQKHWHCSRLQAVKYLLGGLDECSA